MCSLVLSTAPRFPRLRKFLVFPSSSDWLIMSLSFAVIGQKERTHSSYGGNAYNDKHIVQFTPSDIRELTLQILGV